MRPFRGLRGTLPSPISPVSKGEKLRHEGSHMMIYGLERLTNIAVEITQQHIL